MRFYYRRWAKYRNLYFIIFQNIQSILIEQQMISQSMLSLFAKKLESLKCSKDQATLHVDNKNQLLNKLPPSTIQPISHTESHPPQHHASTQQTKISSQPQRSIINVSKSGLPEQKIDVGEGTKIPLQTDFQENSKTYQKTKKQSLPRSETQRVLPSSKENSKQTLLNNSNIERQNTCNFFGFRNYPSPFFPEKVQKPASSEKSSQKNQIIDLDSQQADTQQNNYEQNPNNKNNLPHTYFMNNLVSLYGKISPIYIRLYLKQLSKKHRIPYNSLIISFGIEQMIEIFYENHQLQCQLTHKYIYSELQMLLPRFLAQMCISNWYVIQKIAKGVTNRFRVGQYYTNQWLINIIKKNKKNLRENGNNVERILTMSKLSEAELQNHKNESAHNKQVHQQNFKTMKNFLATYQEKINSLINFEDTDEQLLQTSDRPGIHSELKFYKKLKANLLSSRQQSKKQNKIIKQKKSDKNYLEQKQYELLNFQIFRMKSQKPNNVIVLEEQFQEQILSTASRSQEQFNKYETLKQKVKLKQAERALKKEKQRQRQREILNKNAGQQVVKIAKTCAPISKKILDNTDEVNAKAPVYAPTHTQQLKLITPTLIQVGSMPGSSKNTIEKKIAPPQENFKYNERQLLSKMDAMLYAFHERQPDFAMTDLLRQITRILREQLKVPSKFHKNLTNLWFQKYHKQ